MIPDKALDQRPKILFISPIMPSDGGNGPAMRAALFVRALAKNYQVYLHVIPVLGTVPDALNTLNLDDFCRQVTVQKLQQDPVYEFINNISLDRHRLAALAEYHQVALSRFATPEARSQIQSLYASVEFAAIHVFRLYMVAFIQAYFDDNKIPIILDMDDYESVTHHRFAELYRRRQMPTHVFLEHAEAVKYTQMEQHWIPCFKHVYLSNEQDYSGLVKRFPKTKFRTLANAISIPKTMPKPEPSKPFTLLYIGTMSYFPNQDAVMYFCTDILPALRQALACEVNLVIAGANPSQNVLALSKQPGVQVTGRVSDLAPLYHQADIVVAPIRAGGGTRIKILEAFAYQRPVIATTLALEGIAAIHETHVLIADNSEAFIKACISLIGQADQAKKLSDNAYVLVCLNYSQEIIMKQIQLSMARVLLDGKSN